MPVQGAKATGAMTIPRVDVAETEESRQVLDRSETLPGGHMSCMLICRPAMGTATTALSPKQAYRLDATLATPTVHRAGGLEQLG